MRAVMTLLLALVASFAAGGLVVQLIAQAVRGDEVYIVAFVWVPVAVTVCLVVLGLAGAIAGSVRAVDRAALALAILAAIAGIALFAWSLASGGTSNLPREAPLIAALVVPTWVVIATQWWFVRRRAAAYAGAAR
jgi:hypothetical protein